MGILYFFESIRNPIFDELMLAITTFGEEMAFIVAAMLIMWCVDKRQGYYVMCVGFFGLIANQFLKLVCAVPRPWVKDPDFTIVEEARLEATGYSFPSGHTQSAVGTFGSIAATTKNKVVRIVCLAICVLAPVSRMYLGVHTPQDVLVSAALAVVLILVTRPIIYKSGKAGMCKLLGVMLVLGVLYLCYAFSYPFSANIDLYNLESGREAAVMLVGCSAGLACVYVVDTKWLHFPTRTVWWGQVLKMVGGLAVVMLVKSVLKTPLNDLLGPWAGRGVRYFLMVITAGVLWPMWFRFLPSKNCKEH